MSLAMAQHMVFDVLDRHADSGIKLDIFQPEFSALTNIPHHLCSLLPKTSAALSRIQVTAKLQLGSSNILK